MLALAEQVIGDDPSMASPPDRLGAHDRTAVSGAQRLELGEPGGKGLGQRIIRIVAEAANPPIPVRRRLDAPRLSSEPAKRGNMFVADLPWGQRLGKLSRLNCGLVRERGIDLTSTTKSTRNS